MNKLRWTPRSAADFRLTHAYLLKEAGSSVADAQWSLVLASLRTLQRFPNSGAPAEPLKCRKLIVPHTPYTIFYRERREAIEILSIRHGAQRPLKRLPKV